MRVKPVFDLGTIEITNKVTELRNINTQFDEDVKSALIKYCAADFTAMQAEKLKLANENAVKAGNGKIFGIYNTNYGDVFIITNSTHTNTYVMLSIEYEDYWIV